MYDFMREKRVTAKNPHTCHICKKEISVGEKYNYEVGRYDGDFYSRATCDVCDVARWEYLKATGGIEYDGWCVTDYIQDTVCSKCERGENCNRKTLTMCEKVRKVYAKQDS